MLLINNDVNRETIAAFSLTNETNTSSTSHKASAASLRSSANEQPAEKKPVCLCFVVYAKTLHYNEVNCRKQIARQHSSRSNGIIPLAGSQNEFGNAGAPPLGTGHWLVPQFRPYMGYYVEFCRTRPIGQTVRANVWIFVPQNWARQGH